MTNDRNVSLNELLQRDVVAVEECSDISWRTHVEVRFEQIDGESVNIKLLPASALDTRATRDDGFIWTSKCGDDE